MVKHVDDEEEDDDNSDDEMTLGELHFTCRHELWHCFAVGLMMVPILMMEPMMDTDDADLNQTAPPLCGIGIISYRSVGTYGRWFLEGL